MMDSVKQECETVEGYECVFGVTGYIYLDVYGNGGSMKIAHIAPPWLTVPPVNYGGTETVLANLIEEQVALGHEVTLLAPADAETSARLVSFFPRSLINTGVPWQAHLKAFYHFYKAVDFIQEHDFDIIHTHLSSAADMYLFPLMSGVTSPHIMTLHSRFPFDRVGLWTGDADELYMEWARTVPIVTISKKACEEIVYPLNFIGVVHHGLPLSKFVPTARPEEFFVWLGRIVPEKGTHLAIRAAKLAGVSLVLAGNIDSYLPEAADYFEHMIRPHLDGRQIRYIGPVNLEQKIDLLSRARGLLNPIEWEEPFGMVMIEAMASGCPVIAFARGSTPELIVHGKTGFLVHDIDAMVRYISRVGKLDRAVVRAHVAQNFSSRVMAEKYLALYKKVIMARFASTSAVASARLRTAKSNGPFRPVDSANKISYPADVTLAKIKAEPAP
jgi:glycosyltransferase involved in cell wall biosynthesis